MHYLKNIWRWLWQHLIGRFMLTKRIYYAIRLPKLTRRAEAVYNRVGRQTVIDTEATINKIINENLSVVRYGDGEFRWMLNITDENMPSFQHVDPKLSARLKEVLQKPVKNCYVCIPIWLAGQQKAILSRRFFWYTFITRYYQQVAEYLDQSYAYGNANWTDVQASGRLPQSEQVRILNCITDIWRDKHVLIIEGKGVKNGVETNIFAHAKKVERIIAPAQDAFAKYDQILAKVKTFKPHKNFIILIMLGPTATVLAYDLAKQGYRAIDMGHIDKYCKDTMPSLDDETRAQLEKRFTQEVCATIE